jgi:hypothetical protein
MLSLGLTCDQVKINFPVGVARRVGRTPNFRVLKGLKIYGRGKLDGFFLAIEFPI